MDLLTANDTPGEYPRSYYADVVDHLDRFSAAEGDLTCDVCVIGAGFTGLSTAYHLAQRGYDVVVLEAQRVGFGASGRNGGQASTGQRRDQEDLEAMVGDTHARALWDIGCQAVDLVRDLCATDEVRTAFHPGIVHTVHRKRDYAHSEAYVAHMQEKYGYDKISLLEPDACPAGRSSRSIRTTPAARSSIHLPIMAARWTWGPATSTRLSWFWDWPGWR